MRPTQTTLYTGETCKFTGRKPLIYWGRKNPISHLSRMKNPDLPYPSVAAALRAYVLRPASLDVSATLGTTASFSGLLRPGFTTSQLYLANCLLCLVAIALFPISYLSPVCYLLLTVDHCHIRYAFSPPKAYWRRKGDSPINYCNIKASGIYYALGIFCA